VAAESNGRTLRQRLLKRVPIADDLALTLSVRDWYPVKRRAAMAYCDVPAAALVAGGFVYYPPPGGARIKSCLVAGDNGSPGTWRWGLATIAAIATSGSVSGETVRPVWSDAGLRGQFEAFQFFGIGDLSGANAAGMVAYPDIEVFPPNIFIAALTGDNAIAEGYLHVEEYLAGDEEL
jgi:hypothetical protein